MSCPHTSPVCDGKHLQLRVGGWGFANAVPGVPSRGGVGRGPGVDGRAVRVVQLRRDRAARLARALDHKGLNVAVGVPLDDVQRGGQVRVFEARAGGAAWKDPDAALLANIETRNAGSDVELRYLHRHANLEDVFLKLTGRDLRE